MAVGAAGCSGTGSAEEGLSGLPGAMADVRKTAATAKSFAFSNQAAIDQLAGGESGTSRYQALRLAGLADQKYPAAEGEDSLFHSPPHQALGRCLGDGVIAARFGGSPAVPEVRLYATGVRLSKNGQPTEVWCTALRKGADAQAVSGRILERLTAAETTGAGWSTMLVEPSVSVRVEPNIVEVVAQPASDSSPLGVFLTALDTRDLDNLTTP